MTLSISQWATLAGCCTVDERCDRELRRPLWGGHRERVLIQAMRWGRSAYETDSGLRAEADSLRKLGVELQFSTDSEPQMKGVEILVVTSGVRVGMT